jgi:hypothetical protein
MIIKFIMEDFWIKKNMGKEFKFNLMSSNKLKKYSKGVFRQKNRMKNLFWLPLHIFIMEQF